MPGFLALVKDHLPTSPKFGILPYMTATLVALQDRLPRAGERTRATVKALKGYRGITDQDIAKLLGWTRQKVQSYVAGPTRFTDEALVAFGYALEVPGYVLMLEKDDALRWVLDHPHGPDAPDGQEKPFTIWETSLLRFPTSHRSAA